MYAWTLNGTEFPITLESSSQSAGDQREKPSLPHEDFNLLVGYGPGGHPGDATRPTWRGAFAPTEIQTELLK